MAGRCGESLILYSDRSEGSYARSFDSNGIATSTYAYVDESTQRQIISGVNTAFGKSYTEIVFEQSPYAVGESIPDWAAFTQIN